MEKNSADNDDSDYDPDEENEDSDDSNDDDYHINDARAMNNDDGVEEFFKLKNRYIHQILIFQNH